jgi:acyl dehydratase
VRPGDTLRVVSTVIATRASRSKPDRGTVTMEHVTLNQDDEVVFSCECVHMLKRRDA